MSSNKQTIQEVLEFIGLSLAYKNFKNDLKVFDKMELKSGDFLTWFTEGAIKVLAADLKSKRNLRIQIIDKAEDFWVYEWIKGKDSGLIRLSKAQLYRMTAEACMKYFNDNRVVIEGKSWY